MPDISQPVVTTSEEKGKKPNLKLILTLVGILILIGAVAAAVILVQQRQELRKEAMGTYKTCDENDKCVVKECLPDAPGLPTYCADVCRTDQDCQKTVTWVPPAPDTSGAGGGTGSVPAGGVGGGTSIQCLDVKVYDGNWDQLSGTALSSFQVGDTVRFGVRGSATSGVFDKARFKTTVDDTLEMDWTETTNLKPGTTNEYYLEQTLTKAGSLKVFGSIHHKETNQWYD